MAYRRFLDYHDPDGICPIRGWYVLQVDEVKVAARYAIREIEGTRQLADCSVFKPLLRLHVGLFTVRIEADIARKKRQFRAAGFWSLNSHELILVDGFEKSGNFTIPPKVLDKALDTQLAYYLNGEGTLYAHSF